MEALEYENADQFSIALLLKSAENKGIITFNEGQPFFSNDLLLIKSVEAMQEYREEEIWLLKGRGYDVGTVRQWKGGLAKKVSDKPHRWAYVDSKGKVIDKKEKKKPSKKKKKSRKKKPTDEVAKKRAEEAYNRYKDAVKKLDPDAKFIPMPGISGGKGILVNEKKNIAYLVSTKGGVRGDVMRKVNLKELRRTLHERKTAAGIKLGDIYDRVSDADIKSFLLASEPKTITISDPALSEKFAGTEQRTFRVVEGNGGQVIIDGSWKGFMLDDMVTTKQRLRGSGGRIIDPTTGKSVRRFRTTESGKRMVNVFHEAYAKRDGGFARIYIPKGDEYSARLLKDAGAERLAKTGHVFRISLTNISRVAEALGGMSMDKGVSEALNVNVLKRNSALKIKFDAIMEEIEKPEYNGYRGADIDGLRESIDGANGNKIPVILRATQVQALKKMVNDPKGAVLGLDTGLGKTLVGVAYHQKMLSEGNYKAGHNGKMIIVCQGSNVATWKEHISTFTEKNPEDKWELNNKIWENNQYVILPAGILESRYGSSKPIKEKGKPDKSQLNPEAEAYFKDFSSIIMDEPQEYMKSKGTRVYQTMVNLDHDRKIISSESVMTKNPGEIVNYTAISNNLHEGEMRTASEKEFKSMFSGARAKVAKEEFMDDVKSFIRDNVIYFHKTDEPAINFAGKPDNYKPSRGEENADRAERVISAGDDTPGSKDFLKAYQKKADKVAATLENMYKDFDRMKGEGISAEDIAASVKSNKIGSGQEIGKELGELRAFIALPENHIPEMKGKNPKIEAAVRDLKVHSANGRTSLAFSMKPELVIKAAKRFSEATPNKISVSFTASGGEKVFKGASIDPATKNLAKHNSNVTFWHNGKPVWEHSVAKMRSKGLQMTEMLDEFKKANPEHAGKGFGAITATDVYNAGHNLQNTASVVMHLDRDNWNPKVIYQRESRVVRPNRQGWVTRGTIHQYDMEMPEGMHRSTDSLEKIRQEHETELFNQIVFGAKEVELEEPSTEFKEAKEVFKEGRIRAGKTKADENALLAGMGSKRHRIQNRQDQGVLLDSTRSNFESHLKPIGALA